MGESYYWLISITTESVTVGLVKHDTTDILSALGPETEWEMNNADSLLHSTDISLSAAAEKALLEPEQEPEKSAFILPPKWIGNDGKIFPEHLKFLENLCRSLKLKPLGFISNDEAFIESVNKEDSFPPSFILLSLGQKEFSLSLVYLGEVKKRYHQVLESDFTPQDLENALVTIRLDSALPPRIMLFGHLNNTIVDDLKNYPWIGKKNIETFLHLPDVEAFLPADLFNLYTKTVAAQLMGNDSPSPPTSDTLETKEEINKVEEVLEDNQDIVENTEEVSATDLGFTEITDSDSLVIPPAPQEEVLAPPVSKTSFKLPKFSLPKISWPHFKIKINPLHLFPLALSPLLLLVPFFLISADLTLNLNPVEINKDFNLSLEVGASTTSTSLIPVNKKTFDLKFSESVPTTGQKETGEKSKGEVTLFNKIDKIQNLAKGTLLTDASGKKYELLTSVQVPQSNYDLASGTITMGQAKVNIIASDIGPEFDQKKDTVLTFKDNANLLARINDTITGGTRRQVKVVSKNDKSQLSTNVEAAVKSRIQKEIDNNASNVNLLVDTAFIDKKQIDYNREIDEEADTLSAQVSLVISVMEIPSDKKESIIKTLLADDPNFLQSVPDIGNFSFVFTASQKSSQKCTGKLSLKGKSLPKIDTTSLRTRLRSQNFANAKKIIVSEPRVYNYQIEIHPQIFSFIKRFPPKAEKITILEKF